MDSMYSRRGRVQGRLQYGRDVKIVRVYRGKMNATRSGQDKQVSTSEQVDQPQLKRRNVVLGTVSGNVAGISGPAHFRAPIDNDIPGLTPTNKATSPTLERARLWAILESICCPLDKYRFLVSVKKLNENVFYDLVQYFPEKIIPLIYTPTIATACSNFGLLLPRPEGLYVSSKDRGRISKLLSNWKSRNVKIVVVTDGERILGLGDLGVHGMGIVTGKSDIYCAFGGAYPNTVMPVALDLGCENQALREDPFYLGENKVRLKGKAYIDLVDEFVECVRAKFGSGVLIHFEDFGSSNSKFLLERYQSRGYNVFNDDIQATSVITLAALLGCCLQKDVPDIKEQKFLFFGAGQANLGIANLLAKYLNSLGMNMQEITSKIWLFDSQGIVTVDRPNVPKEKYEYAKAPEYASKDLEKCITRIKPTTLIGASSVRNAFGKEVVRAMGSENARPIIFSLSNPIEKTECTAPQAFEWSSGSVVFASGTPNDAFRFSNKQVETSVVNNALVFPGIGVGSTVCPGVTDVKLLAVAEAVASLISTSEQARGQVLPTLSRIQEVQKIVCKVFIRSEGMDNAQRREKQLFDTMYDPSKYYDIN